MREEGQTLEGDPMRVGSTRGHHNQYTEKSEDNDRLTEARFNSLRGKQGHRKRTNEREITGDGGDTDRIVALGLYRAAPTRTVTDS